MLKKLLPSLLAVAVAIFGFVFVSIKMPVEGKTGDAYRLYHDEESWEIRLYSIDNKVSRVISIDGARPALLHLEKNLVEIRTSATGDTYLCRFFDRESEQLSDWRQGPCFVIEDRLITAEWVNGTPALVVFDLWDGGLLASSSVPFAPLPRLAQCVSSAEKNADGSIDVTYLTTENGSTAVARLYP